MKLNNFDEVLEIVNDRWWRSNHLQKTNLIVNRNRDRPIQGGVIGVTLDGCTPNISCCAVDAT
jgi:hypothetical protein